MPVCVCIFVTVIVVGDMGKEGSVVENAIWKEP